MLAAVYSMQAVARLLAFGICLAALHAIGSRNDISPDALDEKPFNMKRVVDQVWRWVTGVAIIPAALAIGLRLTIPETPRYYADIRNNMAKAIKKALQVYGQQGLEDEPADNFDELSRHDSDSIEEEDHWYRDAWRYLTTTIAGRHLIVISGLWAIMDLGWYGLSMDSPSALSTLWHDPSTPIIQSPSTNTRRLAEGVCPEFNSWRTDPNSNITIYRVLENNSIRSMLVVSIGSLLGNMALIIIINRFHRKNILITTFCLISLFLAITGGSLIGTYRAGQDHLAATVFFGIMHFLFTIGPKTLILVMAVEMFPTFYRGTFYGIAAATGKVGAIIIRAIIGRTGNGEMALGIRLFSVIPLMLLGAWMSSLLPEVQHVPKKSDTEAAINESSIVERKDKLKINEGSSNEHELKLLRDGGEKLRMSFRGLIFLQKLQDMTLEEIAPNPAVALANYGREIRQ
jgi:PHS family inorganic phosphate transporter-like MFS transporter